MYRLRKMPKRTDYVKYAGYKFEVVDIDNYKIDQLLVTRITTPPAPVVVQAGKNNTETANAEQPTQKVKE